MKETSPHTRGKLSGVCLAEGEPGNIPAYAGKASYLACCCWYCWKHPRIRGESLISISCWSVQIETSPHTRGKPQHIESIIPFCTVFSIQASF